MGLLQDTLCVHPPISPRSLNCACLKTTHTSKSATSLSVSRGFSTASQVFIPTETMAAIVKNISATSVFGTIPASSASNATNGESENGVIFGA